MLIRQHQPSDYVVAGLNQRNPGTVTDGKRRQE